MRFLFIPFILLPVLEMLVLIKVGGTIGALNTVALVILGGVIGLGVVRQQGFRTMLKARVQMTHGELPALEMLEGFLIAIGGLLMILPGFITDTMGIALLIPWVRKAILRKMLASGQWKAQSTGIYEGGFYRDASNDKGYTRVSHTIDGEFQRDISPDPDKKNEKF